MRITEAAQRLGTSPRMLRYRDSLGLLPTVREQRSRRPGRSRRPFDPARPASRPAAGPSLSVSPHLPAAAPHRQFGELDLDAVALELAIERRYDISPASLAFGLRVLTEPGVRGEVAELGRRVGRIQAPAARALDFEQERALRLLSMSRHPQRSPARR
jgi:MerR family transcriptional regulator, copper efflux regulator